MCLRLWFGNRYIFAVVDITMTKMTAVSLKKARKTTEPVSPVNKYVTTNDAELALDSKMINKMWDGTYKIQTNTPPITPTAAGDVYQMKDVLVVDYKYANDGCCSGKLAPVWALVAENKSMTREECEAVCATDFSCTGYGFFAPVVPQFVTVQPTLPVL